MTHQNRADALALVQKVLGENTFENVDIGPINDVLNIDCFVISIPKSGTTALQRGLERVGRRVLHAHNNPTTYEAFANGAVLRESGIGLETVVAARLATNQRPIFFFFGYREPVSWYLSVAGHFSLPMDAALRDNIIENIATRHPWSSYKIEDTVAIVRAATGIDLGTQRFDHARGLDIYAAPGVNLICYRLDRMEAVRDYIVENIDPRFVLTQERVNDDGVYGSYRDKLTLPMATLDRLYDDRWFKHFYTQDEKNALVRRLTQLP